MQVNRREDASVFSAGRQYGNSRDIQSQYIRTDQEVVAEMKDKLLFKRPRETLSDDLINKMFGPKGIIFDTNQLTFDFRVEDLQPLVEKAGDSFGKYFKTYLLKALRDKSKEDNVIETNKKWTKNNAESVNHMLKQRLQWKPRNLVDLLNILTEMVDGQYNELRRALGGLGDYKIAPIHRQKFYIDKNVWLAMSTEEQKKEIYTIINNYKK